MFIELSSNPFKKQNPAEVKPDSNALMLAAVAHRSKFGPPQLSPLRGVSSFIHILFSW